MEVSELVGTEPVCPADADNLIHLEMATIAQSFGERRVPSLRGMPLPLPSSPTRGGRSAGRQGKEI